MLEVSLSLGKGAELRRASKGGTILDVPADPGVLFPSLGCGHHPHTPLPGSDPASAALQRVSRASKPGLRASGAKQPGMI